MLTSKVLTEIYTPVYDLMLLQTFAEYDQVHGKIFTVVDDKTSEYKVDGVSGFGEWEDATEAEDGQYEDPVLGYAKTYTPDKKRKRFSVSFEAVDRDEYAILSKEKEAKAIGRGARARVERDSASVLYNGFGTTGPDGVYLFSASHPKNRQETGTLYDNLLSGAFSHDNLEAAEIEISNNLKDPKGIPIPTTKNPVLAYPPALRGVVARVLSDRANERPGTANRDINRFAGMYDPVEWRFLAADMGGSATAWYVIYKELEKLRLVWQVRPQFRSWIDEAKELYNFSGRMIYDEGYDDWRGLFGSTGL